MTNQALINIANVNNKILEIQRAADTGGSPPEYRGEGIVLLKNFAQGSTNSGKPKYTGTIANIDEVKFNVFSFGDSIIIDISFFSCSIDSDFLINVFDRTASASLSTLISNFVPHKKS